MSLTRPLWRRLVQVLLVCICAEGVVSLMLYDYTGHEAVLLVKDAVLAVTYVAFAGWAFRERASLQWPFIVVAPLVVLVLLSLAELFNPALENVLVPLVGIRTRLLYVPLCAVGYCYVDSRKDVEDFGLLLAVPSIPVNLIGILQYLLGPARVAAWGSGFAAAVWTVGSFGGEAVYRPTATFSATGHFASYLLGVSLLTAAFTLRCEEPVRRWIFRVSLGLQAVAVMVSGARLTLLFVPLGIAAIGLVATLAPRFRPRTRAWRAAGWTGGLTLAGLFLGALIAPTGVYRAQSVISPSVPRQLNIVDTLAVSSRRIESLSGTDLWWGHGLGSAAPGARYVIKDSDRFVGFGPLEGAVGQYLWEMGIPGLVSFVAAWLAMLGFGITGFMRLRDPLLQSVAAAIIVYHACILITSGTYALMAYAPTSVWFWFLLGMLMRLPAIDQRTAQAVR